MPSSQLFLPQKQAPLAVADRLVPYVAAEQPVAPKHKPALGFLSIKDWDERDQPREKFMARGRNAVSDAELLGILLGTGTANASAVDLARRLLAMADGQLTRLAQLEWRQLKGVKGVGDAKAITIAAALELGRRLATAAPDAAPNILSAAQAYRTMAPLLSGLQQEQFWVLLLAQNRQLLRKVQIGQGGISGVLADPRLIFKEALLENATSIILVHNHPSGQLAPSPEDDAVTRRLVQAGKLLDIQIADHIIFADKGYYSYEDANKL